MYDNNNTQWFSQTLLSYKDKIYATEGYLKLSLSTNTEDFRFFNAPVLNISISNNYQKSINLNIQNAKDLLRAFKSISSQLNGNELSIQRKYQKDTILHFTFKIDQNNNRIVVIEIRNNDTDFTKIVIPLESVFESFVSCIREFTEQYMSICSQLFIQSIQSQSIQIINQLPSLIKGISSQIVSQIPVSEIIPDSGAAVPLEVTQTEISQSQSTIDDLDKFLGDDMNNINIPEINKVEITKENLVEVDSLFVKYYLNNDLQNLENAMSNYFMSPCPIMSFTEEIKDKIKIHIKDENFSLLPGISDDEYKSLIYLSKLFVTLPYRNYVDSGVSMPATVSVLKYHSNNFKEENLNIAYDLFLFSLYIRIVRRRLENKIEDAIMSKALFYIQMRCFSDPLIFSFLDKIDKTKLSSIVLTRYRYYNSIGVFDSYKIILSDAGCPEIIESDIMSVVDEAVEKVVGKAPYINDLHNSIQDVNSLRLKNNSTLSLEQIINELIPLEIAEKTGKNINSDEVISELKGQYNISDDMVSIFRGKKKPEKTSSNKSNDKTSNLERLIRSQFADEIPEQYRASFLDYLLEIGNNKFDFNNGKYPVDEFGDNVIKALYLWNPESDSLITKNYKQFFLKVENEIMDRDLILAKIKIQEEQEHSETKINDDWNFA